MLAPFGFNPPVKVLLALGLAALGGVIGGIIGTSIIKAFKGKQINSAVKDSEKALTAQELQ